jgi:signal transduction histidine kinase
VKEALHNILKHAMATEAILKFAVKHNVLSIVINDNGKGFNKVELNRFGNGLNNMRNRMKNINGKCIVDNNNGARITLTLPV